MLKFSGFADLTSCQDIGNAKEAQQSKGSGARSDKATDEAPRGVRLVAGRNSNVHFMHQGQQRAPWCTETDSRHRRLHKQSLEARRQHETEVDSEAGMLSGISRKRSIRSNPCWFTEFCKSQCLSHFAAPFIVVRAETSVAESCKEAITEQRFPPTGKKAQHNTKRSFGGQQATGKAYHRESDAPPPRPRAINRRNPRATPC